MSCLRDSHHHSAGRVSEILLLHRLSNLPLSAGHSLYAIFLHQLYQLGFLHPILPFYPLHHFEIGSPYAVQASLVLSVAQAVLEFYVA